MERSLGGIRRKTSGFTLLELIIVLVVLAALAAMVIPLLGWVRDQAKFATAAATAGELLNNLELYKASTGKYPDRMDTLVDTSGAYYSKAYAGDAGVGNPYGSIASGTLYYYLTNGGGIKTAMYHDPAVTDPNASTDGLAPTTLASTSTFVTIDPTTANSTYAAKMRRIVKAAFPNQTGTGNNVAIPTGHTLVVLGIGSRTATAGSTMTSAPLHSAGVDNGKYARFLAVFDVSAGSTNRGKVQLKLVLDSEFEVMATNVNNFKGAGPSDDQGTYTAATTPAGT